ncbi:hypothetical protein CPB83DRAFT_387606 [Crepidotus variabilis]|uniref:Haemolytic enterotoxin (HBL) n=1 Tax=Crepidotus variabilis TaxID=179855 RepID=A0A9P6EEE5_9AGAR|nr:hypothetical protein CPB83DRAFT_387606 [Crepidotus variabilis]
MPCRTCLYSLLIMGTTTSSLDPAFASTTLPVQEVKEKEPDIQDAPFEGSEMQSISSHYWKGLIAEEVRALGTKIADVEELFASIEATIKKLEEIGVFETYNAQDEKSTPFSRRWQELHDKYTIVTAESRNSVVALDSKIDDFIETVIPILQSTQYNNAQKKNALADCLAYMKEFRPQGNDTSLIFLRLRQEIEQFRKDITIVINTLSQPQATWGDALKKAMKKITDIEAQVNWIPSKTSNKILDRVGAVMDKLEKVASVVAHRKEAIGVGVVSLGVIAGTAYHGLWAVMFIKLGVSAIFSAGAFGALCTIAPFAAGAIVLGLVGDSIYTGWKELEAEDENVKTAIAELESLKADLDLDFNSLGQSLQMIHTAWQGIVDDAQKLVNKFEAFDRSTDPLVLETRINQFKTVYEALQVALKAYIDMFSTSTPTVTTT